MKKISFEIDADTGCWNCQSHPLMNSGYPYVNRDGSTTTLHRHIYMQHTGRQLPRHIHVMHTCDNRLCINPAHLREGTATDNMQDAARKDRIAYGERSGRAKLTVEAVMHIMNSSDTQMNLARRHNVSQVAISHIKTGKNWKRATGLGRR